MGANPYWIKLQRAWCFVFHWRDQVPHSGFGWKGWRCPRCGWMFFAEWDAEDSSQQQPPRIGP